MPIKKFSLYICLLSSSLCFCRDGLTYLEPIPPPLWQFFVYKGTSKLLPTSGTAIWMFATPAFHGEYAVSIQCLNLRKKGETYKVAYGECIQGFLTAPPPPPPPSLDYPNGKPENIKLKIHKASKAIPSELANRVIHDWSAVIKLTRYQGDLPLHMGCDGINYSFGCGHYYGTTWSPNSGLPLFLAQLADSLCGYANRKTEASATTDIEKACKEVEKELERLEVHEAEPNPPDA